MRRRRLWLPLTVLLAVIVVAVVAYRSRSRPAAGVQPMTPAADKNGHAAVGNGASKADASTARAEVSIDPRRQQLIGVRTVVVKRASAVGDPFEPSVSCAMTKRAWPTSMSRSKGGSGNCTSITPVSR